MNAPAHSEMIDPRHTRVFLLAAKHYDVFILVRAANPQAFRFYGVNGYQPKRLDIKAKTAKIDIGRYQLAGLVVDPTIHPNAFGGRDMGGVMRNWQETLPVVYTPTAGQPRTYLPGGKFYMVESDQNHKHYGALYLCHGGLTTAKRYICGDYDLYAIVPAKNPNSHEFVVEQRLNQVHARTPEFVDVQNFLNRNFGLPLVQHGAQESYLAHQDEPILAFEPGGQFLVLPNKAAIENYYATRLQGRRPHDAHDPANPSRGQWLRA